MSWPFFYSVRVIHDNIPSVRDIYIIYSLIIAWPIFMSVSSAFYNKKDAVHDIWVSILK